MRARVKNKKQKEAVRALLGDRIHRFQEVRFNITVLISNKPTLGGPKIEAEQVIGRAMGLREDGQSFYASVGLPWVWGKKYDWRMLAKRRLETFLHYRCTCRSTGTETRTCSLHLTLMQSWCQEDEAAQKSQRHLAMMGMTAGPAPEYKLLHHDYPWCLWDMRHKKWECDICKSEQDAYSNNPTYQRQFILKHSHCGFPAADYQKSLAETNISTYRDLLCQLETRVAAAKKEVDTLEGLTLEGLFFAIQKFSPDTRLPERMSLQEAIDRYQKTRSEKTGDVVRRPERKLIEG